ncbi:MAG: HD-GYP domain-containing protein [Bacillota bacterium]
MDSIFLERYIDFKNQFNNYKNISTKDVNDYICFLEKKDKYTSGHCKRVKKYSLQLANRLNLSEKEKHILKCGSLLHDIGKLFIDKNILKKKKRLTKNEYESIKKHPCYGYIFLNSIGGFEGIDKLILDHHERMDGNGYPFNKTDKEINVLAKIISIADAYDAMTTKRPYRIRPLPHKMAIQELKDNSGTQFDKTLVKEFIESFKEINGDC